MKLFLTFRRVCDRCFPGFKGKESIHADWSGAALDPFNGNFDADAIDGPDILDDLVNQAAPPAPPPHA